MAITEPSLGGFPGVLESLIYDGARRSFKGGATIIAEGNVGDSLFVVVEGTVRIYARDERGRELEFGVFGPGTLFGEMCLDGGARTASVEAASRCVCSEIAYDLFRKRLAGDADFAFYLISMLIGRSRSATESAKDLALKPVYRRVVEFLHRHAVEEDGKRRLPTKITQQELANQVGASRDMISRILKELTLDESIRIEERRITLLRPLPDRW
ncbi:MAG: Crp/Fnr family transcriptional regulator [Rhodocyclaceae bacterium]|jgi:CRP/FNR family cyclic AMP-dependent transcriptional regulator|nr:Crp/Fnr family transcriptional regulator [Rhodocyclaceae bacterium]MBK6554543.1 Crp/Fnr family transcriptional regulator [Rhodocyclaceae bacterium]MBK6677520.1 Crp/Fnr family transcriptional regulator [Rhodocyclaceae bacterium]MBK9310178.1 Crp/Fnr family transcriptional regulator [Rhodocyclaceae bacterium]MBK9954749.1 Crp/Fnr family transcriptional regulator [Rhodocyclaceae bacterium]